MIPPIIAGLINYLVPILSDDYALPGPTFSVWDGESPRFDAQGNAVAPTNTTGGWPAVSLEYQPPGFNRSHTVGTNSVKDEGVVLVQVWDTTREGAEQCMGHVEDAFERQVAVYQDVDIGGPSDNPNYVFELTLGTYGCWMDKDHRTSTSQYLYRGDMYFDCKIHSNAPTTE